MKKSMLSIIGLTTLLTLTGCGTKSATPAKTNKVIFPAESILLNANSKTLFVGESFQMDLFVTPLLAAGGEFVFESSDADVASVTKKGLVKAKKQGHAVITAYSKDNPTVKAEMKVYAFDSKSFFDVDNAQKKMQKYQEQHVTVPRKLQTIERENRVLSVNGKLFHQTMTYYDFVTSKDDAYFKFGINGYDVRYFDGPQVRDSYQYHFHTDADYHSFVFKDNYESTETHNKAYVASEFYLGTETTRDQVVYAMLNSFFISGSKISENNFDDAMGTDMFKYHPNKGGFATDEVYSVREFKDEGPYDADIDDENDLDIPSGTQYYLDYFESSYWYKGNVKSRQLNFTFKYKIGKDKYELAVNKNYTFLRDDEFSFKLPNPSEYTDVDSIFDL